MMKEILERVLEAASAHCQAAEVYGVSTETTPVAFDAGKLKSVSTSETGGVALRIIREGRLGFSTTSKLTDIDTLVRNAIETSGFGQEVLFDFAGAQPFPDVEAYDKGVANLDARSLLEYGQAMVEGINAHDPKIQTGAEVQKSISRIAIANTLGVSSEYARTNLVLEAVGVLADGENLVTVWDSLVRGSMGDPGQDTMAISRGIVEAFRRAKVNVPVESGSYRVIFSPMAVSDLVGPIVASLDGKAVEKGISPWKNSIGGNLLDPRISLIDDPTLPFDGASAPFDDEGMPTRRNEYISKGRLESFYTDLRTAQALGTAPTGNGVRPGLGVLPAPGLETLTMEGGSREFKDILNSTERAIYVQIPMGAWAGNQYSGEISGNIALGYLIDGGGIVGRVKDCLFSLNVFEAFKSQMVEMSIDTKDVGGARLPYAVFDGVSINN